MLRDTVNHSPDSPARKGGEREGERGRERERERGREREREGESVAGMT
jgi:hypothetical protein